MVAGIAFGAVFPGPAKELRLLGTIFLRLIKSIIAPLMFATLVSGIAGAGHVKVMGRIGGKALLYFEIVTTLALFLGLGAVNLVKPGIGVELHTRHRSRCRTDPNRPVSDPGAHLPHQHYRRHGPRRGPADCRVRADIRRGLRHHRGKGVPAWSNSASRLAEVMFRYTNYVMYFAPFGVFGAMAATVGDKGLPVLINLGKLVLTMYGALIFFVVVVLGSVALIIRLPVKRFIRFVREPFLIAFSTASSEAALPLALENMELFGVPRHIVAFVLPTGYSFNLDGSTLYLSLAAVFVAQAAGVHMPFGTQLMMMLTLMLTSKGVAGVPGRPW